MNLFFNSTLNVRNEYSIIKVLVFVSTVTVILSLTYVTHEGRAISGTTNSSSLTAISQSSSYEYGGRLNSMKRLINGPLVATMSFVVCIY